VAGVSKVHLRIDGTTACGLPTPSQHTLNPGEVTCLTCRRSLHMADVEAQLSIKPQPKRRRTKKEGGK